MKKNYNILILGASSDIGVETTKLFIKEGHFVFGHFNKKNIKLNSLKKKYPHQIKLFEYDLTNILSFEKFVKQSEVFKKIDIFISLTGYLKLSRFQTFNVKELYNHLNCNYISSLIAIKKIIPHMKLKKFGRILLSSSIGTNFGGGEKTFLYSFSKFSNQFFPKFFYEINKYNILSNTIKIGVTNTKIHKKSKKMISERVKMIPINRMAEIAEISNFIYNLTVNNTFISNQTISISGGE